MFSTNTMYERTENNKQTNCFLKIFIRKPISLPLKAIHVKSNSRNTDWIVDLFPQVKSAEQMAKLNLISVSDRAHFPIYLENSIKNL